MDPQKINTPPANGGFGLLPPSTDGAGDTTLSEALVTLRKRRAIIIMAVIIGIAYGYYKGRSQISIYEAYGRIEIRSGSSNQYRIGTTATSGSDSSGRIPTEVAIIQSDTMLLTVARGMNLVNDRAFRGAKGPLPQASLDDPAMRQYVLGRLQNGLRVIPIPKTDIIRISYDSLDPRLSADIVNTVIHAYIDHTLSARIEAADRVSEKLADKLNDLKNEVAKSQTQVLELQRGLGVLGFDPSHNQITTSLDDLTKASAEAQINRILAQSRYDVISSSPAGTVDNAPENSPGPGTGSVTTLRSQLTTLQATYAQLLGVLGPNHPQAKALQAQIDETQRALVKEQARLIAQARQAYIGARANEQQTTSALDSQKEAAYKLRDQLVQYTIRQREFEANRTLYEGLLSRIRTASVQAGLESQEIDIVDSAFPPIAPSLEPRSSFIMLYGTIALVVGILLAFLMENLDTGLRSVAEIESITGLASLALIPRARRSGVDQATLTPVQRNLAVLANPKSQFSEAFRALRTSLLLSTAGHPPRIILLTSATPSEGKTTISTNLSIVLAQRDVRVLLIDADLRRPTVHHRFGLNGRIGLTSVLTGANAVEEAIQRVPDVPNLDILASGPVPPFPTEMLGSATMDELLKKLAGQYTHIVIDSPPLLSVTDGVVLARDADAVVLIVRHGKSSKHVVRRARDLLIRAGAPLTGIVLNAVDLNSPEYYGYYGYSGYSYAGVDTSSWESQSKKSPSAPKKGDRA